MTHFGKGKGVHPRDTQREGSSSGSGSKRATSPVAKWNADVETCGKCGETLIQLGDFMLCVNCDEKGRELKETHRKFTEGFDKLFTAMWGPKPAQTVIPEEKKVEKALSRVRDYLNYDFEDQSYEWFAEAVTHSSVGGSVRDGNEQLSRLGEVVLMGVMGTVLVNAHKATGDNWDSMRHRLETRNLARLARSLKLDKCVVVGQAAPSVSDSMAKHVFCALCSAIAFDGGHDALEKVLSDKTDLLKGLDN